MNELDILEAWHPAEQVATVDAEPEARTALDGVIAVSAPPPAPGRRFAARALVAAAVTTVLVTGGVVVATRMVDDRLDGVKKVHVGGLDASGSGAPMNVLVIGSDSRAFVQDTQQAQQFGTAAQTGGSRSDTMILVRIAGDRVTAVWLPRDLLVPDARGNLVLLNSFAGAGPAATVDAIRTLTGEPVDHYVEVDFPEFVKVVDALGGVRMWVPAPMRDVYSGLDVAAAGCTTFDGSSALAWARSRHAQYSVNGAWTDASPHADLDRIGRQQSLLRAIGTQVRARVGADLGAARDVVDTVAKSLVVDSGMDRDTIRSFVGHLVRPEDFVARTAPVEADPDHAGRLRLLTRPPGTGFITWAASAPRVSETDAAAQPGNPSPAAGASC